MYYFQVASQWGQVTQERQREMVTQNLGQSAMILMDKIPAELQQSHEVKAKSKCTPMDRLAFLAHFRFVRGWPKKKREALWAQVENNPQNFRTTGSGKSLRVWVPHLPSISEAEVLRSMKVLTENLDKSQMFDRIVDPAVNKPKLDELDFWDRQVNSDDEPVSRSAGPSDLGVSAGLAAPGISVGLGATRKKGKKRRLLKDPCLQPLLELELKLSSFNILY